MNVPLALTSSRSFRTVHVVSNELKKDILSCVFHALEESSFLLSGLLLLECTVIWTWLCPFSSPLGDDFFRADLHGDLRPQRGSLIELMTVIWAVCFVLPIGIEDDLCVEVLIHERLTLIWFLASYLFLTKKD
mgnify:CR=1 FL=1